MTRYRVDLGVKLHKWGYLSGGVLGEIWGSNSGCCAFKSIHLIVLCPLPMAEGVGKPPPRLYTAAAAWKRRGAFLWPMVIAVT